MSHNRFLKAIKNYQENQSTDSERLLIDQWLDQVSDEDKSEPMSWTEAEISSLKARILDDLPEHKSKVRTMTARKRWIALVVAAAVLLFFGLFLFLRETWSVKQQPTLIAADHILPVEKRATITLDNGEVVELHEGTSTLSMNNDRISTQQGVSLWEDEKGVQQVRKVLIRTPKGAQLHIALADGTQVHMNAESSLQYPLRFSEGERRVVLDGEAYFDVAHQFIKDKDGNRKRKPFIVESTNQTIEVLGTQFNVKAYGTEEYVKTNLISGLINLKFERGQSTLLQPNQQSILARSTAKVRVTRADPESSISWRNNIFAFHNAGLKEILSEIERWYDVRVDIDQWPSDRFYGEVKRDEPLSNVLELIESSSKLRFKIVQVNNERRLLLK